ncbi:MAG TPA: LPS export ABC transporter periplasmic protein LptC [Candidatus Sulfotelmatobacter sp.]|nr:LPS export ABC transporter periplasmic protein LptC [Candidatus Sulfotelmatobacter sp.]
MNHARRAPPGSHRGRVLLAALGLGLAALMAVGCGERRTVGMSGKTGELPDQEVQDFSLTETNQGAVEWRLFAQYAAMYDVKNLITARGVRVDFYDEKSTRTSQLTAREGEINQLTRDMTARGNVVLQSSDGTRMSTQVMHFLNREQKVQSDDLVRVERAGDVLTGVGFESDPELKHFKFRSKVQATVHSKSEDLLGPRKPTK